MDKKTFVTPISKIYFPSALVAMENLGVKVYFVEHKQFHHYLSLQEGEIEKFLSKLESQK